MLLKCSSCNSKYLVNSADLKPNGRTVQCVKCNHQWFQEPGPLDEDVFSSSDHTISTEEQNANNEKEIISSSNLPATYVKETKTSILNSFLVLFILAIIIFILWIFKNEGIGILVLGNFYFQEFFFNLKLIINDFAKIIHHILN